MGLLNRGTTTLAQNISTVWYSDTYIESERVLYSRSEWYRPNIVLLPNIFVDRNIGHAIACQSGYSTLLRPQFHSGGELLGS